MSNEKNFSDEMLKKYISSEIEMINKERSKPENWKKNEEFHSQITLREQEDGNVS